LGYLIAATCLRLSTGAAAANPAEVCPVAARLAAIGDDVPIDIMAAVAVRRASLGRIWLLQPGNHRPILPAIRIP
jgi:hypothetical protein